MQTETRLTSYAPPLTPKLAPWMVQCLDNPELVHDWLSDYGSPLHVVVESEFRRNVTDLVSPLQQRGLTGGLFFARKANKLPWFVTAAKQEGIGVDTASLRELNETLKLGVAPEKITVTAIGKNRAVVEKAVSTGCLIVIDNEDELELVSAVAAALNKRARIGLRFSGFVVNGRQVFSRFGFAVKEWAEVFASVSSNFDLQFELLHAHLDRYDIDERACAARRLIALVDDAAERGCQISAIDLGGGIVMRYLESELQWSDFVESLKLSVLGERPSFTYRGDGLGFYKVGDQLHGNADLYPAWNNISKERFIAAILDAQPDGVPLRKELAERKLQIFFEPGRALLDNTGMTFARVTHRKRDGEGNLHVGVKMNRTNLRPFRAEFCSDPFFLSLNEPENAVKTYDDDSAYISGNLCSESDLIFRRKVRLPAVPQPDDIIAFANTAGYLAHHMEIGTHGDPLPTNILVDEKDWRVCQTLEDRATSDY